MGESIFQNHSINAFCEMIPAPAVERTWHTSVSQGLDFPVKVLQFFEGVSSSLGNGLPHRLYRGTFLIRNGLPLGPYRKTLSRALW